MSTQVLATYQSSSSMPEPVLPAFDDLGPDFAQRLLPPQDLLPHAPPTSCADNLAIAPWTAPDEDDQAPLPPPKLPRPFGISQKASFASFAMSRQLSTSTLSLSPRPSEVHSPSSSFTLVDQHSPAREPRRSKSSLNIFSNIMKTKRSRSRLRSDVTSADEIVPPVPPLDPHHRDHAPSPSSSSGTMTLPPLSLRKLKGKKKATERSPDSPVPEDASSEFKLDTDLDRMDGIIDPSLLPPAPDSGSPRSAAFDHSASDGSSINRSLGASSRLRLTNATGTDARHLVGLAAQQQQHIFSKCMMKR